MNRTDAFELLGLPAEASGDEVRRRYAERYAEYQVRLTNAPTAALQKLYREKLAELQTAQAALVGEIGASVEDLPGLAPTNSGAPPAGTPAPRAAQVAGGADGRSAKRIPATDGQVRSWARPSRLWFGANVVALGALLFIYAGRSSSSDPGPQGLEFVLIYPGTFQMGSTSGDVDERPVHTVNITRSYLLQRTEVTQGQWRAVMGTSPSHFAGCDACPVEQVSWADVQQFLASLNAQDPGKGYRLPTEAEWEYAARAGTTGDYGGNGVLGDMGWYIGNSSGSTHQVGQKLANAWGLFDMHGNVWEWVQDWYSGSYYASSPANDPQGPSSGYYRVLRGGSWSNRESYSRSALRRIVTPGNRSNRSGFRLARTP